jgi:hypothetical protein
MPTNQPETELTQAPRIASLVEQFHRAMEWRQLVALVRGIVRDELSKGRN